MAKRERNKRAARKARQAERERVSAAQAAAGMTVEEESSKSLFSKSKKSSQKKAITAVPKSERKGLIQKLVGYLSDVRSEMHQVTWPTRLELRNYSVAVVVMLVIFGVAIWLVDTGFVALLVQYTGLRG
jgi:preprotein translocase subunit SecE